MAAKTNKNKLSSYQWRGTTAKGKKVKGQTLAYSEQEARQTLNEQKIRLEKIKKRSPSSWVKRRNTATEKDITLFTRQMATMLEAGVPWVKRCSCSNPAPRKQK